MKEPNKRVLVGMSGGIDSTTTCLMLRKQGYEVASITMRVWGDELQNARELVVCMRIGYYVADEHVPFKDTIVKNSIDKCQQRRTPNPCVMCNLLFKSRMLVEWADKLGCDWIATGYCSRLEERNGYTCTIADDDEEEDQSYFPWRLGQGVLRRCIFPLGNYTKQIVRGYLREKGYKAKSKEGEGMEICFTKGNYRNSPRGQCPESDMETGPGWLVSSEGVELEQHRGFPYYTIGQRKGLEIALDKPTYVLKINPRENTVMLGDTEQLKAGYMATEQDNIVGEDEPFSCPEPTVRIRYHSRPIPHRVKRLEDGHLLVRFLAEVLAIAPEQPAVFYDGRRVIGEAFIVSQHGTGLVIEQNKNWE